MSRAMLGFLALCVACGARPAPPSLVADRDSVEFATTAPGESSEEVAVRISNQGGQPTTALSTTLVGGQPEGFAVVSDGCNRMILQAGSSCDLRLAFRPAAEQPFAAQLRVAGGNGSAAVALKGLAESGVRLSLSASSYAFGGVESGKSASTLLTISNGGTRTTQALAVSAGGDRSSFYLRDECSARSLASRQSCDILVTFTPDSLGPKAISLAVTSGAVSTAARLDGYGKGLVTLTVTKEGEGAVATQAPAGRCADAPCSLLFEIGMTTENATLVATPGPNSIFVGWSGDCSGSGASCQVAMSARRAVLAKFAPAASLSVEATVLAAGDGVISVDPGTACAAPCTASALVRRGTRVRLTANAGKDSQFRWTGACSGTAPTCELTVNANTAAGVVFNGANYVFVTSQTYPTNLRLAGYDDACNRRARVAGLPGPYVAWMSSSTASASARVFPARGFIRVDGRPFADSLDGRAGTWFPPSLDEFGSVRPAYPGYVMTGTDEQGFVSAGYACSDWTVSGAYVLRLGDPMGGAGFWSGGATSSCQIEWPIYCLGTGLERPLHPPKAAGRLAFISASALASGGGLAAADALCRSEAAAAHLPGSFKALLAVEGASAISRFNLAGPPWVRPDGIPVVERAADLAEGKLIAPIGVEANGTYDFWWSATFAGGQWSPGAPGTTASTCASWTSSSPDATCSVGIGYRINDWFGLGMTPCNWAERVVCLQE